MDVVQILTIAFGAIGFVGGAVGQFSKGRSNAIIKGQSELIDVRNQQLADNDKQIAAITAERDSLKEQVKTLSELAQGSPQLAKFTKALDNNTRMIKTLIDKWGSTK